MPVQLAAFLAVLTRFLVFFKLSGSLNIYGFIEMCKIGSNASGTCDTPMIDRGRWQVSLLYFRHDYEWVLIQRRRS